MKALKKKTRLLCDSVWSSQDSVKIPVILAFASAFVLRQTVNANSWQ